MIAVVTDSASMLPAAWRDRWEVGVAPMTVVLDGTPHREGSEISTGEFYRRLAEGASVSTSAPSPGDLLDAYRTAMDAGATSVVAVHTGSAYSAVLDSARIAARSYPDHVELVDTGTVSFPVALCVAAACDARDLGGDTAAVVEAARATAAVVDSIFIVGAPHLARGGGRLGDVSATTTMLTLGPSGRGDHGTAADVDDAISEMALHVRQVAAGRSLRVGVGDADRPDLGDRLAEAITGAGAGAIAELTRYEVGPSVGAHSGAGTVGAVWAPLPG